MDYNRAMAPHFHRVVAMTSNYRFLFLGHQPRYMRYVKAQLLTYRDVKSAKLHSSKLPSLRGSNRPSFQVSNHVLLPGNTSFYHAAHWTAADGNEPFMDNVVLLVEGDPATRAPKRLSAAQKTQCIENMERYPHPKRLNALRQQLSDHIEQISTMKDSECLHSSSYQIRWSDEDINGHLNQSTYIKMAEDVLFQYVDSLRSGKMVIFSMSSLYLKEIKRDEHDHVTLQIVRSFPVDERDGDGARMKGLDVHGIVVCDGDVCNGFIARVIDQSFALSSKL